MPFFICPNLVNEKVWFFHKGLDPKVSTMIENPQKDAQTLGGRKIHTIGLLFSVIVKTLAVLTKK